MRKMTYEVTIGQEVKEVKTYKEAVALQEQFGAEFTPKFTEFEFDPIETVEIPCPICGKISHMAIKTSDRKEWEKDKSKVDEIFSTMPKGQKEILAYGTCIKCQKR